MYLVLSMPFGVEVGATEIGIAWAIIIALGVAVFVVFSKTRQGLYAEARELANIRGEKIDDQGREINELKEAVALLKARVDMLSEQNNVDIADKTAAIVIEHLVNNS